MFSNEPFTTRTAIKAHEYAFRYFGGVHKQLCTTKTEFFVRIRETLLPCTFFCHNLTKKAENYIIISVKLIGVVFMDVRVQVVLVFSVIFVASVVLAIFREKERRIWIFTAMGMIPMAVCLCVIYSVVLSGAKPDGAFAKRTYSATDGELVVDTAAYILAENDVESVGRFISDYTARYPVTDKFMLLKARYAAMIGNYKQASGIYEQLENTSDRKMARAEKEIVSEVVSGSRSHEQLSEEISENIRRENISKKSRKAAEAYIKVTDADSTHLDRTEAKAVAKELAELDKNEPGLMSSEPMRMAQLKAMMYSGDYKGIAEFEVKLDTSNEYLVLAELLRRGRFSDKMITGSKVIKEYMRENRSARSWIETQRKKHSYSKEELKVIEKAMEQFGDDTKSYYSRIKNSMKYFASRDHERESSKLYLQLSRMEFDEGNDELATEYLRKALQTAGDGADKAYSGPVAELNEILSNKNDTEAFKNIDKYTDLMVDNMVPVDMKIASDAGTQQGSDQSGFSKTVYDAVTDEDFDISEPIKPSDDEDFSEYVSTNVNQMNAAVTISKIDATKFDKVTAIVAVDEKIADTEEEFKEQFGIDDCDVEIKDYRVEKLEDTDVNIVLCCDNSGSMSGTKIENLKAALMSFSDELDADVEVGIVAFDSSVLKAGSCSLGSSVSELRSAISEMGARGGTNIRSGVEASLAEIPSGDDLNIIIVMSDGQDSRPSQEALNQLSNRCSDLGVTIYTMGLGNDVDSGVLSAYSDYGGGNYTFVSDSDTLLSFYKYIYATSKNRFRITYKAEDTLRVNRHLFVYSKTDTKISDLKSYSLYETSDLSEEDLGAEYSVSFEDLTVGGLDTRLLYKATYDQEIRLRGKGLTEDHSISITIKSGMTYELPCEYISPTEWKVTVPSKVACGEYDVYVSVDGKKAVFDSGLVVTDDNMNIVRFGQYVFESSGYEALGDSIKLTGYVTMNDWLGFSGGVTLKGDTKNATEITMDTSRVYVIYKKGDDSLNGLAKFMAGVGLMINIRVPEAVTLYRNEGIPSSSESFRVSRNVMYAGINIKNLFTLTTPGMSFYPDKLKVDFEDFTTEFPFQDKLLKSASLDKIFEYKLDHEETLLISGSAVDCVFKLKIGSTDKDLFHEARFGNMRLLVNLNDLELNVNTEKEEYKFKIIVNIGMLCDGLGLELGWKKGNIDTARIYADKKITKVISGVPITFSDFKLGVTDLADKGLESMMLEGSADISTAKISDIFKGLEKFIDDAPVLKLDDVTMKLRFGRPYISLDTKAKLFDAVDLGKASVELGMDIPYNNSLIDYSGTEINGFVGRISAGLKFKALITDIDVSGSGELAVSDQVVGATFKGNVSVNIEWWILHKDFKHEGGVFLGMYRQHNGTYAFGMIAQADGGMRIQAVWTKEGAVK